MSSKLDMLQFELQLKTVAEVIFYQKFRLFTDFKCLGFLIYTYKVTYFEKKGGNVKKSAFSEPHQMQCTSKF